MVQALDRNLDRGLNEVVAGLSQYFAATSSSHELSSSRTRKPK